MCWGVHEDEDVERFAVFPSVKRLYVKHKPSGLWLGGP
jgi:hypothetical protein